jgi:hypothetical protein
MNVVLGYDPIGWGVPYGGLFSIDTAKEVILLFTLDFIVMLMLL